VGDIAGDVSRIESLVRSAKAGDNKAMEQFCALLARVAFITPEATPIVYNSLTRVWLGLEADTLPTSPEQEAAIALLVKTETLPGGFWSEFWRLILDTSTRRSAEETTARVSALTNMLPASFHERAEILARAHPGLAKPDERVLSDPFALEVLQALPAGSLGHAFYRLIVDQKFDLEVADRNIEELRNLPPVLHYVNVRMVQMHDVWHLAAGYTTSALHENALASFQLAQFGHTYGAMYLATVVYLSFLYYKNVRGILLQVIAEAWYHSTQCPSFMDIHWESEWHLPIAEIRQRHGIRPFESIYGDTLIEAGTALSNTTIFKSIEKLDRLFGLALHEKLSEAALKVHVWCVAREKAQLGRKPLICPKESP
jgi:ubiquinone biosynthesis protein Coq4